MVSKISIFKNKHSYSRGFTHILNVIAIPYNIQGSTYDTIWVLDGGVYKDTYSGFAQPEISWAVYSCSERRVIKSCETAKPTQTNALGELHSLPDTVPHLHEQCTHILTRDLRYDSR